MRCRQPAFDDASAIAARASHRDTLRAGVHDGEPKTTRLANPLRRRRIAGTP